MLHSLTVIDNRLNAGVAGICTFTSTAIFFQQTGMIPLHYAAWEGIVEVVNVLVKAGSKVDEKNNVSMI